MMNVGQEAGPISGIGEPGEIRLGSDGNLYQWIEGIDHIPAGYQRVPPGYVVRRRRRRRGVWGRLKRIARGVVRAAAPVASFLPGGSAAVQAARAAGFASVDYGLAGLYQAPDGNLYDIGTIDQVEDLGRVRPRRLAPVEQSDAYDELGNPVGGWIGQQSDQGSSGLAGYGDVGYDGLYQPPDEALHEVHGLSDDEVHGFDASDDIGQATEFSGFIPDRPRGTTWSQPGPLPDTWRPLW